MKAHFFISVLLAVLVTVFFGGTVAAEHLAENRTKPYQVVIVRHADKKDKSKDSALSVAGKNRANALGEILEKWNVQYIHSTKWRRTYHTAYPAAESASKEIMIYQSLSQLAEQVQLSGGKHLVIGHSNTVNEIVQNLGGTPGGSIDSKEYDRLYLLEANCSGQVATKIFSYPAQKEHIQAALLKGLPECQGIGASEARLPNP
ncbi:histidine phosphatase family protein [Porticoccus sp. W117]|uniref:histidine phosphatase family protein n=1 Tax=Porticoccus sp. W117 TaxID=3054777 RepID=UPI002597CDC5|nr:histidine phosphatase family protein [Porticoccus sp. W117]MDM3869900.1 histidine phosphatase family protein [Porticoccus sp. W117]